LLVEAGLTPLAALQAATLTAAEALGKADMLGVLESSKLADSVMLDADPLADIRTPAVCGRSSKVVTCTVRLRFASKAAPTDPARYT
jgi:imidazolonepropionase-like amidohydrolase